jgi:hypothetical protein
VVDQFGATNTSTLTITITGTNDAPVIVEFGELAAERSSAADAWLCGRIPVANYRADRHRQRSEPGRQS